MTPVFAAIALALLLSLGGNGLLAWAYLGQRDAATAARSDADAVAASAAQIRAAAAACSDSVQMLSDRASSLQSALTAARAQSQTRASGHYARADRMLATPAPVPGDVCASAQARVRDVLANRARKQGGGGK